MGTISKIFGAMGLTCAQVGRVMCTMPKALMRSVKEVLNSPCVCSALSVPAMSFSECLDGHWRDRRPKLDSRNAEVALELSSRSELKCRSNVVTDFSSKLRWGCQK